MTAAQYQGLGTITAAGTDTITLTTALTGSVTGLTAIESYVLGGTTTNAFTLDKAAETVTASAGADNISVAALPSANTVILGLTAADTITTTNGADLSAGKFHPTTAGNAALVTGAGTLVFAGSVTVSAAQLDGFTTLTGSATPNVTVNTAAVTAAMLDNAVISTTLTTITLGDFANAITSAETTVGAGKVLNVTAAAQTASNALTFIGTLETDGTFSVTGGAGADAITGGSGIDTIIGGAGTDVIRGGVGDDSLTGGNGTDKFIFEATAATNGNDKLVDFKIGAAGSGANGGDILSFVNFIAGGSIANASANSKYTPPTSAALALEGTSIAIATKALMISGHGTAVTGFDTPAEVAALLADAGAWDAVDVAANGKAVIIAGAAATATTSYVYAITNDATATVTEAEITLIGTITNTAGDIAKFASGNIVFA
jgi:hypothetical protein